MKLNKVLPIIFTLAAPIAIGGEIYDGKVNSCRVHSVGDVRVYTESTTSCGGNDIVFPKSALSEKTIDRFLSLCLAGVSAGKNMRIDYMSCSGTSSIATGNTTVHYKK